MAEFSTIARPYAEAVFELAKNAGDFDKWSEITAFLANVVSDDTVAHLIANPRTQADMLKTLLLDIGQDYLDDSGQNFVKLLVDNRRLLAAPEIASQYEELKARHQGYASVEVLSASEVTPEQQQALESALKKRLGKDVNISTSIDNSLIGGWLIRSDDKVIDMSIKGRLQQLANELRH